MKRTRSNFAALVLGSLLATQASAQVILLEDFENGDGGWLANGQPNVYPFLGNPDHYLGVPFADFWGITLRNEQPSVVTGDLTRHGAPIRVNFDMNVFRAETFFGNPLNAQDWPLVLELVDYTAAGPVSVYTIVGTIPEIGAGWQNREFIIPDPTQAALPPGWGGTGDEDPLGNPRLPANRTYTSVLQSVDEFRVTTMVPGFFYIANFWEAGWDNIQIELIGCRADLNGDGVADFNDYLEFLNLYNANDPRADFNGDSTIDFNDYLEFLNLYNACA